MPILERVDEQTFPAPFYLSFFSFWHSLCVRMWSLRHPPLKDWINGEQSRVPASGCAQKNDNEDAFLRSRSKKRYVKQSNIWHADLLWRSFSLSLFFDLLKNGPIFFNITEGAKSFTAGHYWERNLVANVDKQQTNPNPAHIFFFWKLIARPLWLKCVLFILSDV